MMYQYGHMLEKMETTLKKSKTRYLGDAFMLISGIIKPREAGSANWEYTAKLKRGDPLHPDGAHFRQLHSMPLFDPEVDGGLGLQIAPQLLEARIRTAGQMSCPGTDGPRWMSFQEAQRCYQQLSKKAEKEWEQTVEELRGIELSEVFPERDRHDIWGQRSLRGLQGELSLGEQRKVATKLDVDTLNDLHAAIRRDVNDKKEGVPGIGCADWESAIRQTFLGVVTPAEEEWASGGADVRADAEGGRLFCETGDANYFGGGEATWMRQQQVDQDGFLVGWRGRADEMREGFSFDSQGYLCHKSCGRIQQEDLTELLPAVQMVARARIALGDVEVLEGDGKKRETTHVQLSSQYKMWAKITTWAARIDATKVYTLDGSRRLVPTPNGGEMLIVTRAAVDHTGRALGGRIANERGVGEDNYHAELVAQLDALDDATRNPEERVIIIFDATSPVLAMLRFARLGARARGDRLAAELLEHFERLRRRCAALVLLWQTSHVGEPINEYADITCDTFGIEDIVDIPRGTIEYASITFPLHLRSAQEYVSKGMSSIVASRLRERVQHTILRDPEEQIKLLKLTEEAAAICEAVGARRYQYVDQPYPGKRLGKIIETEPCPFGCLKRPRRWREIDTAAAARLNKRLEVQLANHLEMRMAERGGSTVELLQEEEKELGAEDVTYNEAIRSRNGRWFARDACKPSWWHFHFECTGEGMITARKQYALKAVKARRDLLHLIGPNAAGKGQGHGQLNDLIVLTHLGLQGWEAEDGAAGSTANQEYLRARIQRGETDGYNVEGWHRAAAGAIDRTGNKVDDSGKWRASITEMVIAGCELQRLGKEKCKAQANALRNQIRNWSLLGSVFKAWSGLQLAASVQRTVDLRDIRLASLFVRQRGSLDGHERRRLLSATVKLVIEVDETSSPTVPQEWLQKRVWLAWRLVLARGQGRSGRIVVHGGGVEPLRSLLWVATKGYHRDFRLHPASVMTLETLASLTWRKWLRVGGMGAFTHTQRKLERIRRANQIRAQREGMRKWARMADGTRWRVLTEAETEDRFEIVNDKLRDALRKSQVLTTREWKELDIKGLRLGHFVQLDGTFFYGPEEVASNHTLSGSAARDHGETIEIEIEPRAGATKAKERRKAVLRSRREIRKRNIMRAVVQGEEPDDSGRWAVNRIVQVARPPVSRRGRPLRVLVNWEGTDEQGMPWHDSWVSISMLTADQKSEARRMERDAYGSADAAQGREKRQKRVKQGQEDDRQRWEVRLRSRKRTLFDD